MENKPRKLSGTFFNCISIDRNYNNQQSILPHMHDNRLELFYVCSGQGQYMVDNRYTRLERATLLSAIRVYCTARNLIRCGRSGRTASQLPMSMQKVCRPTA